MNGISSPMKPQRVLLPLLLYVGTRKKSQSAMKKQVFTRMQPH